MKRLLIILAGTLCIITNAMGQTVFGGKVEFDKTVHNFGDIVCGSGPVVCTFTLKNVSSAPIALYSVYSTCGCTVPTWSKEPILPGKTAQVKALFKNEDGPGAFDKTIVCNVSGVDQNITLHLKGTCYSKGVSLEERYPVRIKDSKGKPLVGFKKREFVLRNVAAGKESHDEIEVANLTSRPLRVHFDSWESLEVEDVTLEPREVKSVEVKIHGAKGGKDYRYGRMKGEGITPSVKDSEGRKISSGAFALECSYYTLCNFDGMTQAEKVRAPKPIFEKSTLYAGELRKTDKPVRVSFKFTNTGDRPLEIHAVDSDTPMALQRGWSAVTAPGGKGEVAVEFVPSEAAEGEVSAMLTLTTNSPSRPLVNIFVAAVIK